MNSRPTIQQYRRLAEGLLRKALDAPVESKQDLIYHAVSYLAFARAQEQSGEATVNSSPSHLPNSDETENRYSQVRQLIKKAIEMPTPDGIADLLNFSTTFRRLGIWNARMAYIQRPGARVIASEYEWKTICRSVVPDAIPIMILWPFSPIRYIYELEDTVKLPRFRGHPNFGVFGVHNGKKAPALYAGIPPADDRAGSSRSHAGGTG